jgi:hypothetical protein
MSALFPNPEADPPTNPRAARTPNVAAVDVAQSPSSALSLGIDFLDPTAVRCANAALLPRPLGGSICGWFAAPIEEPLWNGRPCLCGAA